VTLVFWFSQILASKIEDNKFSTLFFEFLPLFMQNTAKKLFFGEASHKKNNSWNDKFIVV
jgi:hypothetical protein